jgi:hypothetical protein
MCKRCENGHKFASGRIEALAGDDEGREAVIKHGQRVALLCAVFRVDDIGCAATPVEVERRVLLVKLEEEADELRELLLQRLKDSIAESMGGSPPIQNARAPPALAACAMGDALVGAEVRKKFQGAWYTGIVQSFSAVTGCAAARGVRPLARRMCIRCRLPPATPRAEHTARAAQLVPRRV